LTSRLRHAAGGTALFLLLLFPFPSLSANGGSTAAPEPLRRGLELLERGDYGAAERAFEAAVRAHPGSAEAHYYLGLAAARGGRPRRAIAAYLEAQAIDPDLPSLDASLGIAHYQADELERARSHLERAVETDPHDTATRFFLGLTAQRGRRYREAIEHLETVATHDPALSALAWYNIGRCRAKLGDGEAARRALERAIELDTEGETGDAARSLLASLDREVAEAKRWWLTAGLGFEYDDNLTVSEADLTSNVGDTAGVFDTSAGLRGLAWKGLEFELGYDFYQSVYADQKELNLQIHSPRLWVSKAFRVADGGASYGYTHTRLGGDAFYDLHDFVFYVGRSFTSWWYGQLTYNLQGYSFADVADRDRNAARNALVVDQIFSSAKLGGSALLSWRLEGQAAKGAEFDYVGNYLNGRLRVPLELLTRKIALGFDYEYAVKSYTNVTASIGEKRKDRSHRLGFSATVPLLRHLSAVLDYSFIRSKSNLPSQHYDENILTLRAQASF
jgi:tetratricopeptide (TPR) repeat protein